jgi:hypothetical protein
MARRRLDAQASGFEPAYELADVLPHSGKPTADACLRSRRFTRWVCCRIMRSVVKDPSSVGAFREWEGLVDGMPRVAREAYHWERDTGWSNSWGE